eukprot:GFYU01001723.1.p1 GENE.GFYU01001723.1~~GFYU01001723.1.p1  ORF type:complete len:141 (+),score=5.72 GFYU01001723.1:54-476(+)
MSLSPYDFKYAILVTVASHALSTWTAATAGLSRLKHKVPIHQVGVGGPPEYHYFHRRHQNHVEQYASFLVSLWMTSAFFHDPTAGALGCFWLFCRVQYTFAYKPGCHMQKDVGRWTVPAYMSLNVMLALCTYSAISSFFI